MSDFLNLHRKAIYDTIKGARLNPDEFKFEERDNIFKIEYQDSKLFFEFRKIISSNNQFKYKFKTIFPHKRIVTNYSTGFKPITFNSCLGFFDKFLKRQVKFHIKETRTPNPWNKVHPSSYDFIKGNSEGPDEPFTKQETIELRQRLNALTKTVTNEFKLQQADAKKLQEHVEKLIEASKTQSKKDWKMFAVGVLISIVTTLSLDTSQGKRLYKLFIDVLTESLNLIDGLTQP